MASVGLLPATALIVGVLWGTFVDSSVAPLRWVLVAALAASVATWTTRRPTVTLSLLLAAFTCCGALLAADARQRMLDPSLRRILDDAVGGIAFDTLGPAGDHDPIIIRAVLLEDASPREGFASLRVAVTGLRLGAAWLEADGGVLLSISGDAAPHHALAWRAGRTIEAPVAFRRPARYLNHGVRDFERDLSLDGTALFGSIKSALLVNVVKQGGVVDEWAADVRAHVRAAVGRWVAPHDVVAAGIVTAVLIGDRTGLPDDIRDRLQAAGTYHVIAISGGNIAILTGLVVTVLMVSGLHGRTAALIVIAVLLAYAQIATSGPSVWRATLMAVVYFTARLLDHRTAAWQAASMAAALILIIHPVDVRDPGFVLTFGATGALIEGARRGRALGRNQFSRWVTASIAASLAVELVLLPVSAQAFSRVTAAGLVLNLIAVPTMAVAQVAGIVVVIADPIDSVARVAGWTGYLAAAALVESARLIEVAPWFTSRVPPPGALLLAAYYLALAGTLFARRSRIRRASGIALAVAFLAVAGVHPFSSAGHHPPGTLRLTMFDVGQGEALLVQGGAGTLHIDTGGRPFGGGSFDIGARVLAPALWARGIRALDTLLVTHGDPDHIGGAPVLLEDFRVRTLWEGVQVLRHVPSAAMREAAAARGTAIQVRRAGQSLPWGDAMIRVLHPPEPDWERPRIRNDDSVVLEILYRDVALLLTGDISAEIERAIAPRLTQARTRILKVAHHGSRTSTSRELLDTWRPQIALISAGRGNTFGHPAPEVLSRLESIGARVFRTDRDGQISVETDGRDVFVRTYVHGETEVLSH